LDKSTLESLCVDCGICCHPAVPIAKGVNAVVPELHCKHLSRDCDGKTACTVYDKRLDIAKSWCYKLEDALEKGLFPDACPYVKDMPNYEGTTILNDRVYAMVKPQIREAIIAKGMPEWASERDWKSFVGGK
jgi:uncharacterized cysteine cluster protein YcgN (CxxCxxCC family)